MEISNDLLRGNKFIAENIAGVIRSILVDEYQDTNELQYMILSQIVKADKSIQVTFVGDTDQAIYGGLGGVAKTSKELEEEFGVEFIEKKLAGCYRTTQRIIDYYCNFQLESSPIYAVSDLKDEKGCLVYNDSIALLYFAVALALWILGVLMIIQSWTKLKEVEEIEDICISVCTIIICIILIIAIYFAIDNPILKTILISILLILGIVNQKS